MYNNRTFEYGPDIQVWTQDSNYKYAPVERSYKEDPKRYNVQTISVEPNDVILVHVAEDLDLETVNQIFNELTKSFPGNNVVIANDYILKGLTIVRPPVGEVNVVHQENPFIDMDTEFNL